MLRDCLRPVGCGCSKTSSLCPSSGLAPGTATGARLLQLDIAFPLGNGVMFCAVGVSEARHSILQDPCLMAEQELVFLPLHAGVEPHLRPINRPIHM